VIKRIAVLLLASVCLTGCDAVSGLFNAKVDCLNPDGQATAIDLIKEKVEGQIATGAEETKIDGISKSKIRASLGQVKYAFEDVRTSKEDPNSTKKFCAGKLKLTFPEQMLTDASKVLELLSMDSLSKHADKINAERDANAFRLDLDFTVQPTDDGKKVYAEIEDGKSAYDFLSAVVGSSLFRKHLEQAKQDEKNAADAEQRFTENAEADQRQAGFQEAKATNQLAEQSINAVWNSIPDYERDQLLPIQRAWIKRKGAECRLQAAQQSIEPTERETARLYCEARMNNERSNELQRFVSYQ
jgi:uncharacterized protein YecT (DUF1311 family)